MVRARHAADLRLEGLRVGARLAHVRLGRGERVGGVLQHLLRHGARRRRLLIARVIVPELVAQRNARKNALASPPTVLEERADGAYGARQIRLGLREPGAGPLRVELDDQFALFDALRFFGEHARHHAGRVGKDRDEVAGDEGVVGLHDMAIDGSPFEKKIERDEAGDERDDRETEIAARPDLLARERPGFFAA